MRLAPVVRVDREQLVLSVAEQAPRREAPQLFVDREREEERRRRVPPGSCVAVDPGERRGEPLTSQLLVDEQVGEEVDGAEALEGHDLLLEDAQARLGSERTGPARVMPDLVRQERLDAVDRPLRQDGLAVEDDLTRRQIDRGDGGARVVEPGRAQAHVPRPALLGERPGTIDGVLELRHCASQTRCES